MTHTQHQTIYDLFETKTMQNNMTFLSVLLKLNILVSTKANSRDSKTAQSILDQAQQLSRKDFTVYI